LHVIELLSFLEQGFLNLFVVCLLDQGFRAVRKGDLSAVAGVDDGKLLVRRHPDLVSRVSSGSTYICFDAVDFVIDRHLEALDGVSRLEASSVAKDLAPTGSKRAGHG
jgi:hypothetical protein